MESTGKYWIPVYDMLESTCKVVLAHPQYVKAIRGKKTDARDARWIADIFKHDLVSGSFIPPFEIRQLRDLMRYRGKDRTKRLCSRMGLLESLLPETIPLADEQFKVFLEKALITEHSRRILTEIQAGHINPILSKSAGAAQGQRGLTQLSFYRE